MKEVREVVKLDGFKGYLSDLGGPSANMYSMHGNNLKACEACKRPSCIHPQICPNLNTDHSALLDIYHEVDALPEIKKSFIGSGVRYDLLLHHSKDEKTNKSTRQYTRELIMHHVSGRLKVAPEHTSDYVLNIMRKPSFELFKQFNGIFDKINRECGLKQQLIPYFISSHPGCTEKDMRHLSEVTRRMGYRLEQVQDFTPTPMTTATEMFYTGYDPYTLKPVFTEHDMQKKKKQNDYFFEYKKVRGQKVESKKVKSRRSKV
jgi:uncharacterized radical SAM protein YgiQ